MNELYITHSNTLVCLFTPRVMTHTSVRRVTHINIPCYHTYQQHLSPPHPTSHVTHISESRHTHDCVMYDTQQQYRVPLHSTSHDAHISESYVTHTNIPCYHTLQQRLPPCHPTSHVMSHTSGSHVTHMNESTHTYLTALHTNQSCRTLCLFTHSHERHIYTGGRVWSRTHINFPLDDKLRRPQNDVFRLSINTFK